MRGVYLFMGVMVSVGCGHAGMKPMENACTSTNGDPGACLAMASDRLLKGDDDGARDYMDKTVAAINASPACLRDHAADGCFRAVVALLRDKPVGLLERYAVQPELLDLVPRWTGSEATGRRVQARTALQGMCTVAGKDPVEQQRACIVLGDLVEDERARRCGPDGCTPETQSYLTGWTTADVIDGYAAACKVNRSGADPALVKAFHDQVASLYQVRGADPVCAVGASTQRGASIPEALANMARMREDKRQRETSTALAAQREAQRIAEMEKAKAAAAEAAAKAQQAQFRQDALAAIAKSDWATTYGLLTKNRGNPVDADVATALFAAWDTFSTWAINQSNMVGAYLDLQARLSRAPKNHAIHVALAGLTDQALAAAKKNAKGARGLAGTWLHKAIMARISGIKTPEYAAASDAYDKLVAATKISIVVDNLAPGCESLMPTTSGSRKVRVKSTLQCVVEGERKFTTQEPFKLKQKVVTSDGEQEIEQDTMVDVLHRTFKVVMRGTLQIRSGAPARTIPIEYVAIVDDVEGSDKREFAKERAAAAALIHQALVGDIEAAEAAKALAAGQKALEVNRQAAAESSLVTHAILTGTSSAELDQVLSGYGVTFSELLPIL